MKPTHMLNCRKCGKPATRYLDGGKRAGYCNDHEPTAAEAIARLRWIDRPVTPPVVAAPVAAPAPKPEWQGEEMRAQLYGAKAPAPEPTGATNVTRSLSMAVREMEEYVVKLKRQVAETPRQSEVLALRSEKTRLEREVARLAKECDEWQKIAEEALDEVPLFHPNPVPPKPVAPTPPKDEKGRFAATADLVPAASNGPQAWMTLTDRVAEMRRNHGTARSPQVLIAPKAEKAFKALNEQDASRALVTIRTLLSRPSGVRTNKMENLGPEMYAMRCSHRLRMIALRMLGGWTIQTFADRSDRAYYTKE